MCLCALLRARLCFCRSFSYPRSPTGFLHLKIFSLKFAWVMKELIQIRNSRLRNSPCIDSRILNMRKSHVNSKVWVNFTHRIFTCSWLSKKIVKIQCFFFYQYEKYWEMRTRLNVFAIQRSWENIIMKKQMFPRSTRTFEKPVWLNSTHVCPVFWS